MLMGCCFRNFRTALNFLTATGSPGAQMQETLKLHGEEIHLLHSGKICLSSFSRLNSPSSQRLLTGCSRPLIISMALHRLAPGCPELFCVEELKSRHWAVAPLIIRMFLGRKIEEKVQSNFLKLSHHHQNQYTRAVVSRAEKLTLK